MSDRRPAQVGLWIPGPLPGLNEMIAAAKGCGGRGLAYSRMKKEWTMTIKFLAQAAQWRPMRAARFAFLWVERNRSRNPDNIAAGRKFIFDGLVAAKVLSNDGWGEIRSWTDTFAVGDKPGVRVEIQEVTT